MGCPLIVISRVTVKSTCAADSLGVRKTQIHASRGLRWLRRERSRVALNAATKLPACLQIDNCASFQARAPNPSKASAAMSFLTTRSRIRFRDALATSSQGLFRLCSGRNRPSNKSTPSHELETPLNFRSQDHSQERLHSPVVKNTILAYASSLKAAGFRSVCGSSRDPESRPHWHSQLTN